MDITDATEFKVNVSVSGTPGIGTVVMSRFLKLDIFRPRSSALICRKIMPKPRTPHRDIVFGARKDGDFIVYAERNNISATETHLPRHTIAFKNDNLTLTAALIRLNVSEQNTNQYTVDVDVTYLAVYNTGTLCNVYKTKIHIL